MQGAPSGHETRSLPHPRGQSANGTEEIRWSPRLPKHKLRRLYEQDALGITDEELLEEVGWGLYMRCRDILAIQRAEREVRCARCDARQVDTYIPRLTKDETRCCAALTAAGS